MSLSFSQKSAVVRQTSAAVSNASVGIIAEYRGLTVEDQTKLRSVARESGVWVKVVKNTLAKIAVKETEFELLGDYFSGPVLFSVSSDPVALAKVMWEFAEASENLTLKVGVMNGVLIDLSSIESLSKLPGREELLSLLLGAMRAPIQKFVSTANEIPSGFARVLAAILKQKEAA